MVFCYFCTRHFGLPSAFSWIDYSSQQDSGPRNLPDLPDELDDDTNYVPNDESIETDAAQPTPNLKVHDIETVSPPSEEDNDN